MIKKFDFTQVDKFDKHIDLSIPNLQTLDNIFRSITHEYAQPESIVLDMGCSTGRFLSSLNKTEGCRYLGIDEVDIRKENTDFEFIKGDVEDMFLDKRLNYGYDPTNEVGHISVVVSMFFLQFLGQAKRERVLNNLKTLVDSGAVLLIAEKVYLNDSSLQQCIHRLHIQEKRKGFTDEEILDKDLQLSVSMFCKREDELAEELKKIGSVNKVWQSYNFMGFVVKR
mgnify:FL=1|jgi:tRNA (cmo5U34)-methyltransferase|tara:strand:+ start:287 stop:961 length:675 start_codon:yes stop_codon:yes gene_type:complete